MNTFNNYKIKKLSVLLFIILLSLSSYAKDLSMSDLRTAVLDKNLDIKIQYEKYYQAEKNIYVSLGEFLPHLSVYMFFYNSTFAILQSTMPLPSTWFKYKSSKKLAKAEQFTNETIRLNILEGLSKIFYNIKYAERSLSILNKKEEALDEFNNFVQNQYDLGYGEVDDIFFSKRAISKLQEDKFLLEMIIESQKESLLIALNDSPRQTKLSLTDKDDIILDFPKNVLDAQNESILNSTELVSNHFEVEAARYMVKSARWSFISFEGIGFGYPSTVDIEKSKRKELSLIGEKTKNKIINQVNLTYREIAILEQRINNQKEIIKVAAQQFLRNKATFDVGLNRLSIFKEYTNSKLDYYTQMQNLFNLKNKKDIKLITLKRLLGRDSSLLKMDLSKIENLSLKQTVLNYRKTVAKVRLSLNLPKVELSKISKVTYLIKLKNNENEIKRVARKAETYFYITTDLNTKESTQVVVRVTLNNGLILQKTLKIKVGNK